MSQKYVQLRSAKGENARIKIKQTHKNENTRDGTRTRTAVKPADFKSAASTIPPPELFAVVSRMNIQKIRAKSKPFFVLSWVRRIAGRRRKSSGKLPTVPRRRRNLGGRGERHLREKHQRAKRKEHRNNPPFFDDIAYPETRVVKHNPERRCQRQGTQIRGIGDVQRRQIARKYRERTHNRH